MKIIRWVLFLISTSLPITNYAAVGAGHVSGKISNITSVPSGILVQIGSEEVPQNCTSPYVYMEIKEEYKSMISMTLTAWTLGRNVVVYTAPASTGYCQVIQVDPYET